MYNKCTKRKNGDSREFQAVFYYLKVDYNKLNPKATVEKNKINE